MRPGAREICAERDQLLTLHLAEWQRSSRRDDGDLAFDLMRGCQRLVPASLQLAGDETIGGIDSIVLPACMGGLIASIPNRAKTRSTSVLTAASVLRAPIEMHRAVPWFMRAP